MYETVSEAGRNMNQLLVPKGLCLPVLSVFVATSPFCLYLVHSM